MISILSHDRHMAWMLSHDWSSNANFLINLSPRLKETMDEHNDVRFGPIVGQIGTKFRLIPEGQILPSAASQRSVFAWCYLQGEHI